MKQEYKQVVHFFGEDPTKMRIDDFFGIFASFMTDFQASCPDLIVSRLWMTFDLCREQFRTTRGPAMKGRFGGDWREGWPEDRARPVSPTHQAQQMTNILSSKKSWKICTSDQYQRNHSPVWNRDHSRLTSPTFSDPGPHPPPPDHHSLMRRLTFNITGLVPQVFVQVITN